MTNKSGQRMLAGSLSLGASMVATRVFGLIGTAIVGRLLTPADFGIVALAAIVTGAFNAMLGRSFEIALIRIREPTRAHIGTAMGLSIIWGISAAAAALLVAEPVAALLGAPQIVPALHWLALAPLIDGFRNPAFALHEKGMNFGMPAMQEVASRFSVLVVSVALAVVLGDYRAIIAGLIAHSVCRTAFSHFAARVFVWPNLIHWREFAAFSGWINGSGLAVYLNRRIDRAMIAAKLGMTETGYYRIGNDISDMATSQITWPLQRVLYPRLAMHSEDPEALQQDYRRAQGLILMVLLPLGVGAALTASELLRVIVGYQWLPAAPVIQAIAPALALGGLTSGVQAVVFVKGDTQRLFARDMLLLLVTIPALWIGLELGGFVGVIIARVATLLLSTVLTLRIVASLTGTPWYAPITAGWRTIAACGAMTAAIFLIEPWLPTGMQLAPAAIRLFAYVTVGGAVCIGAQLALWNLSGAPRESAEGALLKLLSAALTRRRSPAGS